MKRRRSQQSEGRIRTSVSAGSKKDEISHDVDDEDSPPDDKKRRVSNKQMNESEEDGKPKATAAKKAVKASGPAQTSG